MPKIHLLLSSFVPKKKNKTHLLALPFNSREKRKERRMRTYPFYFICLFVVVFFLFFFGPLKALQPPPAHPFKSELLAPGFLKMLVRLDCV
jgi:hypothetical protein